MTSVITSIDEGSDSGQNKKLFLKLHKKLFLNLHGKTAKKLRKICVKKADDSA
jgi:hypothetical protein